MRPELIRAVVGECLALSPSAFPLSPFTARELLRLIREENMMNDYDWDWGEDGEGTCELQPPSFWTAQTMALAAH